jgi:polyhydroxyalkanoate synthesis regulator phasin
MPGFGEIVQKAFYLGVGLASYAGAKAGGKFVELRSQVQKLADEMVAKGEISTEEARRLVEEMMKQVQRNQTSEDVREDKPAAEPRRIEILEVDEESAIKTSTEKTGVPDDVSHLREKVLELQKELKRLQNE